VSGEHPRPYYVAGFEGALEAMTRFIESHRDEWRRCPNGSLPVYLAKRSTKVYR